MIKKTDKNKKEEKGATKSRPKQNLQKKLIQMQMADGKMYNKHGVKSIDELLGISTNKYKIIDDKEYEKYIDRLNTSDLQAHATKVGVLPNQDRNVLTKRLLKEFKLHVSSLTNTAQDVNTFPKKIKQEVLDILAQGR